MLFVLQGIPGGSEFIGRFQTGTPFNLALIFSLCNNQSNTSLMKGSKFYWCSNLRKGH